ncbi:MAG TPA: hypothetical protein VFO16_19715 [Pseudonocardiaceae bacterium]|nr:hypothetical protein [Pseudonocardiaceae bacterium]
MTSEGNDPHGRITDDSEYGQEFPPVRPALERMSLIEIMGCPMPERGRFPWLKVVLGTIFVALLLLSFSVYTFGG